eukprot:1562548-Rhodomonas_salina.4
MDTCGRDEVGDRDFDLTELPTDKREIMRWSDARQGPQQCESDTPCADRDRLGGECGLGGKCVTVESGRVCGNGMGSVRVEREVGTDVLLNMSEADCQILLPNLSGLNESGWKKEEWV